MDPQLIAGIAIGLATLLIGGIGILIPYMMRVHGSLATLKEQVATLTENVRKLCTAHEEGIKRCVHHKGVVDQHEKSIEKQSRTLEELRKLLQDPA